MLHPGSVTHFDLFNHSMAVPIYTKSILNSLTALLTWTQIQMPMVKGQGPQIHIHFSRPVVKQTGVA